MEGCTLMANNEKYKVLEVRFNDQLSNSELELINNINKEFSKKDFYLAVERDKIIILNAKQRVVVEEASSDIETFLKQRYDMIPNLVEIVKGYAKHEKGTFTEVTELRAKAMGAGTLEQKMDTVSYTHLDVYKRQILACIPVVGFILLFVEKNDNFVRYMGAQFTVIGAIQLVLGIIPVIGWALSGPFTLIVLVLIVVGMVKASKGERFDIPVVSKWALKLMGSL